MTSRKQYIKVFLNINVLKHYGWRGFKTTTPTDVPSEEVEAYWQGSLHYTSSEARGLKSLVLSLWHLLQMWNKLFSKGGEGREEGGKPQEN